jgi:hypothetical protein
MDSESGNDHYGEHSCSVWLSHFHASDKKMIPLRFHDSSKIPINVQVKVSKMNTIFILFE